jgi:integrase
LATKIEARMIAGAKDGWTSFGDNLYLRVDDDGRRKRWIVRVIRGGRKRELGCGALKTTSLDLARRKRDAILEQLRDGLDPTEEKRKEREEAQAKRERRKTFAQAAEAVLKARAAGWRTSSEGRESSMDDWVKSLARDCKPLRSRPVDEIDVEDIKRVVAPFWDEGKTATARRLLNRIELVIEYALAHGWRSADNPASWKRFQHIAPSAPKNGSKPHHAALDWKATPDFVARLRQIDTTAARCLEFLILTASRSGEARGARWSEVDFDGATWAIPPERMKAGEPHDAPLSRQALDLLRRMEAAKSGDLIFESDRMQRPLDVTAILKVAQKLAPGVNVTVHGFRSSFRSWCGDHGVEREVAEQSLAHSFGSQVEQAYNRTAMLERRRPVLQRWADFVTGETDAGKVVKIGRNRR